MELAGNQLPYAIPGKWVWRIRKVERGEMLPPKKCKSIAREGNEINCLQPAKHILPTYKPVPR